MVKAVPWLVTYQDKSGQHHSVKVDAKNIVQAIQKACNVARLERGHRWHRAKSAHKASMTPPLFPELSNEMGFHGEN